MTDWSSREMQEWLQIPFSIFYQKILAKEQFYNHNMSFKRNKRRNVNVIQKNAKKWR